jgi:uncharacterized YigZ family protein
MAAPHSFKTLGPKVRTELKIRGSRFIATACAVRSREEATLEIGRIQKEFWDATHNCYAWRLAPDGLEYRFSDDGEPGGSAGKPILFAIQQNDLVNALVVVTRYFGGTKLGVGGLARAYSETATTALGLAEVETIHPSESYRILAPYEDIGVVRSLIENYAVRFEEEFLDVVNYVVELRLESVEEFSDLLTDVSHGRAGMVRLDPIETPPEQ